MQNLTSEQKKQLEEKLKSMTPEQINDAIRQQCLFCKIARGDISCHKIYEDEKVLAFLDIQPLHPGHVLVIPKEHYSFLTQLPDDLTSYLFTVVKKITPIVFELMHAEGILVIQRNGPSAGQLIPHIHVHIIPTYKGDDVKDFKEREKADEADLKNISLEFSNAIKKIYGENLIPPKSAPQKQVKKDKIKNTNGKKANLPRVKPRIP